MEDNDIIQYVLPERSEIMFSLPSAERGHLIKLLEGVAELRDDNLSVALPLGQEYELPVWQSLQPRIKSYSGCNFLFKGNHYVLHAVRRVGKRKTNLFTVSLSDNSYIFILSRETQLQTFVGVENGKVYLTPIRGKAEMFGSSLVNSREYLLPPCSSVLVNVSDDDGCTVKLAGNNRRIKVSLLEERTLQVMKEKHAVIQSLRAKAMNGKCEGPTVLVIGPLNSGKTTFCHFLLNKAVEEGMNPVYIDLDVRSSHIIPGTISLMEIKNACNISEGFFKHDLKLLHFGKTKIDRSNIQHYYQLIRKMGDLFKTFQLTNTTPYCGTVIDICGFLGQDDSTIDCVLKLFKIDLVIVIGDQFYYQTVKDSILKSKQSELIPQFKNIEPQSEKREMKRRDRAILKYFYGTINKPLETDPFVANFSDFKLFEVVPTVQDDNTSDAKADLSVSLVKCQPGIEKCILGVVKVETMEELNIALTEIDYFVCFSKIDMETETVTVISPQSFPISGKILIMGAIKMPF